MREYNIFISHSWTHTDAYEKLTNILKNAPYFSYNDYSVPKEKDNIDSIETHGIIREFIFTSVEEFLNYVFSINKNQLLAYYNQMGYLAIDSEKYYKRRIKLKKYYKKLK